MAGSGDLQLYRYPQSKSVDAVRWLRPVSAFDRFIAAAVYDTDDASSSVEIHSINPNSDAENPNRSKPLIQLRSTWPSPSRISSLRTSETAQKHVVAALSTSAGSVHFLFVDPIDVSVDLELSTDEDQPLHYGSVSVVDLQGGGHECLSVGEDGRVNLVRVGEGRLENQKIHDNRGLVSYTAVKWGSQAEFATGGFGFGLQWWDQRKPGGLVSQLKGNWRVARRAQCLPGIYGGNNNRSYFLEQVWRGNPTLRVRFGRSNMIFMLSPQASAQLLPRMYYPSCFVQKMEFLLF